MLRQFHDLLAGGFLHCPRRNSKQRKEFLRFGDQLSKVSGWLWFGERCDACGDRLVVVSQRNFHAPVAAPQIDRHREVASLHIFEQQGSATQIGVIRIEPPCGITRRGRLALAHPVGDLGDLEQWGHGGIHPCQFSCGFEFIDEA